MQPKFNGAQTHGNYGYYHSNTTNYGSYNHAFTSSPSTVVSGGQNSSASSAGTSSKPVPPVTYDNFGEGHQLNIDKSATQVNHLSTNRYSLHVRASPISPTYSQFSSGVSVKNVYPISGNGYGSGLKNASFDYVPSDQLRAYNRYSVPDNYAVYVNSTSSPMPTVVPIPSEQSSKTGSLATHV